MVGVQMDPGLAQHSGWIGCNCGHPVSFLGEKAVNTVVFIIACVAGLVATLRRLQVGAACRTGRKRRLCSATENQ